MALLDRFRATPVTEATVPAAEHAALANEVEFLSERLAEAADGLASLRREDIGWKKLGGDTEGQVFTREEMKAVRATCLAAYIRAPLIGRGVRIRRNYCWGGGVEIAGRDADDGGPVNDLIQQLLDSPEYLRALGSAQAREEREVNLHCAGEFFLLAVHDEADKTVRPRLVPAAQIVDYFTDPDDPSLVLFYKRVWTSLRSEVRFPDRNGQIPAPQRVTRTEWHPTLEYRPALRDRVMLIGVDPVRWDQPIQHCAVNSVGEAPWGIPHTYAAIDWDKAYADYLGRWAGLMTALARYAFKVTVPSKQGPKVTAALRNGRGTDPISGAPTDPIGATAVMDPAAAMAPMHSSGATIDSGSGKPLAGMVAAALDVPITMLLADPGVTGARATAETLDRPLELTTGSSQEMWTDWLKAFFAHVVTVAVEDQLLPQGVDSTVDVTFPPLSDDPVKDRLDALQVALDAGSPPLLILRLMLEALGVEDIDEVLDELVDERGNFIDPRVQQAAAAVQRERDGAPGSQAEEAYR